MFLILAFSWLMKPGQTEHLEHFDPIAVAAAAELRKVRLEKSAPPVLPQDVDLTVGPNAAWWPRGESPLLAELVRDGYLPPVVERTGTEPLVLQGSDGTGRYGGTWQENIIAASDYDAIASSYSYANLLRFSPQGYPLVPHVAKSWEVSPDLRVFTFHLRKGMRWSDGHPYTADDVLYWWEHEINEPLLTARRPQALRQKAALGQIEKINDHAFQVTFPEPNGAFLEQVASINGVVLSGAPAHYLRAYHPRLGDPELIERTMRALRLPSPRALYNYIKRHNNPEHPRLWPWVYRTHKASPPWSFVRNPYYFAVDTEGNQLPYIDRLLWNIKSPDLVNLAAASGEVTLQTRLLNFSHYTLLMTQRARHGYEVYHWYPATRSGFVIIPNLNKIYSPAGANSDTRRKHDLLIRREFRQALSLAINREVIIRSYFNGVGIPSQVEPGPDSLFHSPELGGAYIAFDPHHASALLDGLGLQQRDGEGFRTFADGTRMHFFIHMTGALPGQVAQLIVDDWERVGIRASVRVRSNNLFILEAQTSTQDFAVMTSMGDFHPLLSGRMFAAVSSFSYFAKNYSTWYERGGLFGHPEAAFGGAREPAADDPLRRGMEIFETAKASALPEQPKIFREALKIAAENTWTISIATPPPALVMVKNGIRNVPRMAVVNPSFLYPGNVGIETFYLEQPTDTPGTLEQIRQEIIEARSHTPMADAATPVVGSAGRWVGLGFRFIVITSVILALLLLGLRHPYIGRRLVIMVPTLAVISVVIFVVIQLPPGDYLTAKLAQLSDSGVELDRQEIEDLRSLFHFDEPVIKQYLRWSGLYWFTTFDDRDRGLLQGNLGRSMETGALVNDLVGDRILLTFCISLGTILFTWAVAVPIGIYSAVRQYSVGDYLATFIGYFGLCVPNFLLAVVLMFVSSQWFGINVTGLFSPAYAAQPEWSWGKVVDLLQHLWVPILVLGVGSTAGLIRVMRANLLDELKKPYVTTARAKGLRPVRLLLKYPVRLALNPFVSSIGGIFPSLVSGGAIVAVILSLPTVGPLLLSALTSEDMYLAGSMLMILSCLGLFGTLVSDLLLLVLDPRIRLEGGV